MLKVYNTLKRTKEEFQPINPPYVGMYVCGPTVYGDSHLGHARSYTVFDVIYRYLKYKGFKVRYVQNITDVGHLTDDGDEGDDKIQNQARMEKLEPVEIAYKYELSYFEDMKKLNIEMPDISCRATGHILEMIDHIEKLIEKKHAYVTEQGNVYFDVHSFPGYGKLSGRKLDETKEGERVVVADDKKNPQDFALWKNAGKEHLMQWNSPWGKGYPGWHLECSVMSRKYIGDTLDIHGGGMDNVFPHHECEIAQSESLTGKTFTKYFLHNNMLTVDGQKMGKSLGNFIVLKDLFKELNPMVLRFYILQGHYRSLQDFSKESLEASKTGFDRMKNSILALKQSLGDSKLESDKTYEDVDKLKESFIEAMDDDFNTPIAISVIYEILKISNSEILKQDKNMDKLAYIYSLISDFVFDVLGIKIEDEAGADKEDDLIELLIGLRKSFKEQKDYSSSDMIRDKLKELGIELKDSPTGTTFSKK